MEHIPVIDFGEYQRDIGDGELNIRVLETLGNQLRTAFETVGFCYIKNHGVEDALIHKYYQESREFFTLPPDVKQIYSREHSEQHFGWVAVETEKLTPNRPADLRECFNFNPSNDPGLWEPGQDEFRVTSLLMVDQCKQLAHRVLRVLAVGLGLDVNFHTDKHKLIGQKGNWSCLRSLYYPPITDDSTIKPGQIRLGEHSDYGSITILFQDDIGGLEVEIPGVGFVPATPIPGTVVVNIGDLMQRWTADQLIATKHRVLIPEKEMVKRSCRQSIGFFIHPDDDVMIRCLDGSNKYEPITSLDYMLFRLRKMY